MRNSSPSRMSSFARRPRRSASTSPICSIQQFEGEGAGDPWIPSDSDREKINEMVRDTISHFKLDPSQVLLVNPNDKVLFRWSRRGELDSTVSGNKTTDLDPRYADAAKHSKGKINTDEVPAVRERFGKKPAEVVGYAPVPFPNVEPEPIRPRIRRAHGRPQSGGIQDHRTTTSSGFSSSSASP